MRNNHKQIFTRRCCRAGMLFVPASLSRWCWAGPGALAGIPCTARRPLTCSPHTRFLHFLACGPRSHLACRSCALNFHYEWRVKREGYCLAVQMHWVFLFRSSIRSVRSPITKPGKYPQRHLVEKGNLVLKGLNMNVVVSNQAVLEKNSPLVLTF